MTWGNPPKFKSDPPKQGKKITPEDLAGDTEHSQQAALFCWAADNCGQYPPLGFMFAVPNGFYGDSGQKAKMKAEGLRTGVPDVMLPYPVYRSIYLNLMYHGLFIEMKVKKNKADVDQIKYISYLRSSNYYVAICYNWEEARDTLIAYLEGKL